MKNPQQQIVIRNQILKLRNYFSLRILGLALLVSLFPNLNNYLTAAPITGIPKVSSNGRYLVRSDGTPFVLMSDTE
ncbi:MAG: hypothetical protein EAZ53_06755 [Bacteroidetes bacterium]|nr:MAG: hypothetical protein EAZ53_06755 [Bacteroidota bacterium]